MTHCQWSFSTMCAAYALAAAHEAGYEEGKDDNDFHGMKLC